MNKTITFTFLLLIGLLPMRSIAKDSTYQMFIYSGEKLMNKVKNFDKFDFDDTAGNQRSGRIKMINDSQFYFVNYFYERGSRNYHLNEIEELSGLNNKNKLAAAGKQRTYISAPTAILVSLFVPFGAYVLLFREIYLTAKYGVRHSKKYNQVTIPAENLRIVIKKVAVMT